jgi:hypothetical protein
MNTADVLLASLQAVGQGATFPQIPGKRLLTMMRAVCLPEEQTRGGDVHARI